MKRLKKDGGRRAALPPEVHADLVETLFGTVGSLVSGIFGGLLVPIIAWVRTHDPIYLTASLVMVTLAALRLEVLRRQRRADVAERRAESKYWETLYGVGAVGFMLAVGLTAALLVSRAHDDIALLYGVLITVGCVGAVAGRNAARPLIVYGQVGALCLPLAISFLAHRSPWYWGLSCMLILILTSVKSTTRFLNDTLVSALLNGREARIQRIRFSTALDSMSHGLCMGDRKGVITVVNQRLIEMFGFNAAAVETCDAQQLADMIADAGPLTPDDRRRFVAAWCDHVAARDSTVFSAVIGMGIFDFRCEPEEQGGFVMVISDVTEARLASQEIERMAHFDALTGLPNRSRFYSQLTKQLSTGLRAGEEFAVLSIDLDQFKEVNDSRGHATGDKLLQLVAERLRNGVKNADVVSRFGGDEFQVLLKVGGNRAEVSTIADRIVDNLSQPYIIGHDAINIGASIGIAFAPHDATTADEILRCADMALYAAKASGRGMSHAFNAEMELALRRRQEISDILRNAMETDLLQVHYQPVVDARSGRVVACEALARLPHPVEGMIPPGEFIAVAEETGLVVKLGDLILRRACSDAMTWPDHIAVAVNFSPRQFALGANVADHIRQVLIDTGLPPHRLEVEITESTLIDAKDALQQLQSIADLGVKIALDDFGTGYSSLSYLRQFPVNKIKIDRSFSLDIKSQASQAIIRSVSVMAKLLNVELVIEGVETASQLETLTSWSVHLIQGYYYSKPQPLTEIMPLLEGKQFERSEPSERPPRAVRSDLRDVA
jgi:diguanylate cyclase (GGDEF)-like protein